MNSPTHTPQPRRVPADTPVLFRVPHLETLRPQTRHIEVEIPLRGHPELHARPEPECAGSGDWPYATKASAATLGFAALLWLSWVVTQGPRGEQTGLPALASQPVDGAAPNVLTSDQPLAPEFDSEMSTASVVQRNPSPSAEWEVPQLPAAAPSNNPPTPSDSVADVATAPGGFRPWNPGTLSVAPPVGTDGVASDSSWVTPASAGQSADASEAVRASATPNPPQFTPYVDAAADVPAGSGTGPMLSETPNGVADWSRYLTPGPSALQPASASLPGAGGAAASGQASGQAIYVDKPAAAAETAAAPFYE